MSDVELVSKEEIGFAQIGITFIKRRYPTYTYNWVGGNLCSLTFELLEQSDPDKIVWDRKCGVTGMVSGNLIQIGPYVLEVLSIDFDKEVVYCCRIDTLELLAIKE